jgi:phosphodiesterase/alkaline phosphatase D-like protein
MGREQVEWLIAGLKASTTTWKVISADMPINIAPRTKVMKFELFNLDGVLQCAQALPATGVQVLPGMADGMGW